MIHDAEPAGYTEYIPNQWYAIIEGAHIPAKKPIGLTRLGQRLVLWRDVRGEIVVQDAACPHRGANLAMGRIHPKTHCLECPYHGFQYDREGMCTRTPCEEEDRPIRKDLRTRTHVVREAHGLIWLWHGEQEPEEELPWFEGRIDVCDRQRSQTTFEWHVSFSRLLEGMLDFHHFPFAHRRYVGGVGALLDPYSATISARGVESFGTLRHPGEEVSKGFSGELSVRFPGTLYLSLGGSTWATVCMCPVTEHTSWGYISYHQSMVTVPWIGRAWTAFLLMTEMRFIQPDDERMLLSSEPMHASTRHNHLVRADTAIAMWHKLRGQAFDRDDASRGRLRLAQRDKRVACREDEE